MHCPLPSLTQIHVKAAGNSPRDDVGADREPKGVIADNRYLDEHADDRKQHQYEREHKPKVHCTYSLRCDETPKTGQPYRARLTSFQFLGSLDFARKLVRPGQRGLIDQR
jgi:hypothetical protein